MIYRTGAYWASCRSIVTRDNPADRFHEGPPSLEEKITMRRIGFLVAGLALAGYALSAGWAQGQAPAGGKPAIGTWGFDLAGMDRSVKPGDDFFRYANGAWFDKATIPSDRPSTGS